MKIVDGNKACSDIAYLFSEVCSIYPITPSSTMAENIDDLKSKGKYNIFNSKPIIKEMQSEAGAAGAMHGALLTGSLASTFTASQGLLLMIPNMYKMAGEMLPGVIHVAARSLATQSLSIFGDHQDIYSTRATGFCMLCSTNVYDAQNLAVVAHLSAIEGSLPFLHFFDGFRTSHEINTIKSFDVEKIKSLVNFEKINEFRNRVLYVGAKKQFGLAENEDIYFQSMEARNRAYNDMPNIVDSYMKKVNKIMGTDYKPFNYYGASNAKNIIVAMGSVCDTIKLCVDILNKVEDKYGLIEVHLYRPFSKEYLLNVLPKTTLNVAVLDRTKESGSIGEPLYLDILSALNSRNINIVGGRYGLASKNVTVSDIAGVYKMLDTELKNNFTIGILDDVTNLSLDPVKVDLFNNTKNIKIYGFGSDGMVSASKDLIKIVNKKTSKYVQGYFEYDSKKSGGVTVSHLRISDNEIKMPFYVENADVTLVTKLGYISKFNLLNDVNNNSIVVINTNKTEEEINNLIPDSIKKSLLSKKVTLYYIDADDIALSNNLNGKISKIMEMVLLHLLNLDDAKAILIDNIKTQFKTKGEDIIKNNINALDNSVTSLKKLHLILSGSEPEKLLTFYEKISNRMGNTLSVKDCLPVKDGSFPISLSMYEKRNTSLKVPKWIKEKCIQCGQCSLVCPHAAIRSFVTQNDDGIPLLENKSFKYFVEVSNKDCTGCKVCVNTCPVKALDWVDNFNNDLKYFNNYQNPLELNKYTIKGSQLQKPLFEFSGACAGCGETPYIKLLTQIVGEKLLIANATGCSSIYGGSVPSTPYSIPWANSLFEDNAEFALGMKISLDEKRNQVENIMKELVKNGPFSVKKLCECWLLNKNDFKITSDIKEKLKHETIPDELISLLNYVPSHSVWAVGGDGWAYDIGYGGLDHVLYSNENINILVLDTEVYSNTGGQSSKATNVGAVASFADMGKNTLKKDLFQIAMNIPNCYVASICLGANMFQSIKAFKEAEEHQGPSIIIAYCPCIEQGIKTGMGCSSLEQKKAVECGYTLLMRYNPLDNKLSLDSKEPDFNKYDEFLNNEVRYNALKIKNPDYAQKILDEQIEYAKKRYEKYKNMID